MYIADELFALCEFSSLLSKHEQTLTHTYTHKNAHLQALFLVRFVRALLLVFYRDFCEKRSNTFPPLLLAGVLVGPVFGTSVDVCNFTLRFIFHSNTNATVNISSSRSINPWKHVILADIRFMIGCKRRLHALIMYIEAI